MRPDIRLDDLVLVRASPEQWRRTQDYQAPTWGAGMSIEDFKRRETQLCVESEFSKNGAFTPWILVPKDDTSTLDYACSCECYYRPIRVKMPEHPQGMDAKCASICSVFTPEANRGKGYAQHMMTLLHDKLAEQVELSVLYSDVGTFYSRAKRVHANILRATGWEVIGPREVVWKVDEDVSSEASSAEPNPRQLDEADLDAICKADAELLKEELKSSQHASAFTILPSKDQIDWQFARCKFYDNLRHPASRYEHPYIDNWGCQLGKAGDKSWAFAIWSYDATHHELIILRLRCHSADQLRRIVSAAQAAGSKQGMKKISAWNVDVRLLEGTGWSNEERKEHLPALAWYGEGDVPEWLCNEHWAWC